MSWHHERLPSSILSAAGVTSVAWHKRLLAGEFEVWVPASVLAEPLHLKLRASQAQYGSVDVRAGDEPVLALAFQQFVQEDAAMSRLVQLQRGDVLVALSRANVVGMSAAGVGKLMRAIRDAAARGVIEGVYFRWWRAWGDAAAAAPARSQPFSWRGVVPTSSAMLAKLPDAPGLHSGQCLSVLLALPGLGKVEVGPYSAASPAKTASVHDFLLLGKRGWSARHLTNFFAPLTDRCHAPQLQGAVDAAGAPQLQAHTLPELATAARAAVAIPWSSDAHAGEGQPEVRRPTAEVAWQELCARVGRRGVVGAALSPSAAGGAADGAAASADAPAQPGSAQPAARPRRPTAPTPAVPTLRVVAKPTSAQVARVNAMIRALRTERADAAMIAAACAVPLAEAKALQRAGKPGASSSRASRKPARASSEHAAYGASSPSAADAGGQRPGSWLGALHADTAAAEQAAQSDEEAVAQPMSLYTFLPMREHDGLYHVEEILGVRFHALAPAEVQQIQQATQTPHHRQLAAQLTDEHGPVEWHVAAAQPSDADAAHSPQHRSWARAQHLARLLRRALAGRAHWLATELDYFVRYEDHSYLSAEWLPAAQLQEAGGPLWRRCERAATRAPAISSLQEQHAALLARRDTHITDQLLPPDALEVHDVLSVWPAPRAANAALADSTQLLVSWQRSPWTQLSWELAGQLAQASECLPRFFARNVLPTEAELRAAPGTLDPAWRPAQCSALTHEDVSRHARDPACQLRGYQLDGVNWLLQRWAARKSCVLADEMGLGKTVQTLSFLQALRSRYGQRGPFLLVVPLSTLSNWVAELELWTELRACVYHASQSHAKMGFSVAREFQWWYPGEQPAARPGMHTWDVNLGPQARTQPGAVPAQLGATSWYTAHHVYRFDVLVTTPEVLRSSWCWLSPIAWRAVVVDEAHSLKSSASQFSRCVRGLVKQHTVLLTGTPLQNRMAELWAVLQVVGASEFASLEQFEARFGELSDADQVAQLQALLQPYVLRRLKAEVEQSLPPKRECVISVQLSALQRAHYRAIFARHEGTGPAAQRSLAPANAMELRLRQVCNHPYLLPDVEEAHLQQLQQQRGAALDHAAVTAAMVACSSKLAVLDKLLHWLRAQGRRVLIFSQFTGLLDILEDYLLAQGWQYARLDGCTSSTGRRAAMAGFAAAGSKQFVFLLSTRAGGTGLNLTAADTVVIYDSDWNPQNDVQAIARVHRIGQKAAEVQVYRFITARTYEAEMFRRASLKLGIHQALFESGSTALAGAAADADMDALLELDSDRVNALLKYGAFALLEEPCVTPGLADVDSAAQPWALQQQVLERGIGAHVGIGTVLKLCPTLLIGGDGEVQRVPPDEAVVTLATVQAALAAPSQDVATAPPDAPAPGTQPAAASAAAAAGEQPDSIEDVDASAWDQLGTSQDGVAVLWQYVAREALVPAGTSTPTSVDAMPVPAFIRCLELHVARLRRLDLTVPAGLKQGRAVSRLLAHSARVLADVPIQQGQPERAGRVLSGMARAVKTMLALGTTAPSPSLPRRRRRAAMSSSPPITVDDASSSE